MNPRALMWVQTRLGLGHLARALSLCGALARNGFQVALAHGGPPAPTLIVPEGVSLIQLPVANASNLESSDMRDEFDQPIDDAWRSRRIEALKETIKGFRPDVFLTESFPLGRWLFAFELVPVLEWMHTQPNRPVIVASVRDILTRPSKTTKIEAMIAMTQSRYDFVLCHSDESIMRLPDAFPETTALSDKTRYTGYLVGDRREAARNRSGVFVVAGGGAMGARLFDAALDAKRIWAVDAGPWTLVSGPRFSVGALDDLRRSAPDGVEIVNSIRGLSARYAEAALIVAQAGYNTVCEALSQGARLTVVPYASAKETEQTIRANRFAELGLLTVVEEVQLSPSALAEAMTRALQFSAPIFPVQFDDGERAANALRQALEERSR